MSFPVFTVFWIYIAFTNILNIYFSILLEKKWVYHLLCFYILHSRRPHALETWHYIFITVCTKLYWLYFSPWCILWTYLEWWRQGWAGARASIFHNNITRATKYDVLKNIYFDASGKVWRLACDITHKAKTQTMWKHALWMTCLRPLGCGIQALVLAWIYGLGCRNHEAQSTINLSRLHPVVL